MAAMKGSQTLRIILLLIVASSVALPAFGKYSGGSGTAQDPYQIATAADLIALGGAAADYDKHFILTADVNLPADRVFEKCVIAGFSGCFDGCGHTIANLTINALGANDVGFFATLRSADIRNLKLSSMRIIGAGSEAGALAGQSYASIVNCHVSECAVEGHSDVGGLVGLNDGEIRGSSADAAVAGVDRIGGLVGRTTAMACSWTARRRPE